jgi:putative glutathione S-transferase
MGEDGWEIRPDDDPEATADPIHGATKLREVYVAADSSFTGRVTVPVLWDRETKTIVNNESREILRMFATVMKPLGTEDRDLSPESLRPAIDAAMDRFYQPVNNGVYRCGFAGTQKAYEKAFGELFAELDHWEGVLGEQRFTCGDQLTEADIALFTTLVRFDPVYYVHFKCNGRLIQQYPNLSGFLRDVYQAPGVKETVSVRHIKQHYYTSHESVNPKRFVPVGPDLSWYDEPHGRG